MLLVQSKSRQIFIVFVFEVHVFQITSRTGTSYRRQRPGLAAASQLAPNPLSETTIVELIDHLHHYVTYDERQ